MPNLSSEIKLLTGGSGTLGKELRKISINYNCAFIAPLSSECDITHYRDVYIAIKNSNCDTVVHAAAATDVPGLVFLDMSFLIRLLSQISGVLKIT